MVEGNRGHHLSVVPYLGKILVWELRGIPVTKSFQFFVGNIIIVWCHNGGKSQGFSRGCNRDAALHRSFWIEIFSLDSLM